MLRQNSQGKTPNNDNSNSGNFGLESAKFNNMYYNMNGANAGSRSQAQQSYGSGSSVVYQIPKRQGYGRHDMNPSAMKNLQYMKK